jgi:hypothetical protein
MKLPDNLFAGERRDDLVEMVDIAPTILDLIGLPPYPRFQGRSLVEYIKTGAVESKLGYASLLQRGNDLVCVKSRDEKLVDDAWSGESQWFDLRNDPEERSPLLVSHEQSLTFRERARRLQLEASLGLHVLIAFDPADRSEVNGKLTCPTLGSYRFFAERRRVQITPLENGVAFRIRPTKDAPSGRAGGTACEYAHLFVSVWPHSAPALEIERDGEPVPADVFLGGPDLQPLDNQDGTLDLTALTGSANLVDPAALEPGFRVYVWYVLPPKVLEDTEMDPKTMEALSALGYLDSEPSTDHHPLSER